MSQGPDVRKDNRKGWTKPRLEQLTVDLTSIAGNSVPFGDNAKFNGKNMPAS